jgi:hypothetical protein
LAVDLLQGDDGCRRTRRDLGLGADPFSPRRCSGHNQQTQGDGGQVHSSGPGG